MKQPVPQPTPPITAVCNTTDTANKSLGSISITQQINTATSMCVPWLITRGSPSPLTHVGPAIFIGTTISDQGDTLQLECTCTGAGHWSLVIQDLYSGYYSYFGKTGGATAAGTYTITDSCTLGANCVLT